MELKICKGKAIRPLGGRAAERENFEKMAEDRHNARMKENRQTSLILTKTFRLIPTSKNILKNNRKVFNAVG
ncbi:MAG: hypothetical protein LBL62_12345 [Planctomycetaceae bacterium]|jgi:hypothetical protein|nr:hypothetical protein [Planctomycetaceae bacterium]